MLREHKIRVGVVKLGFSREVTFELTFSGYIKKCAQGHKTFLLLEKSIIKCEYISVEQKAEISLGYGAETGNHPETLSR